MEITTNLKHKPVIVVEDYDQVDGRNALHTDAKGLSLGLAQWNDRGKVDISGKVWRHTGEKWSRQSEELPITQIRSSNFSCAREFCFFKMRIAMKNFMILKIQLSILLDFKEIE